MDTKILIDIARMSIKPLILIFCLAMAILFGILSIKQLNYDCQYKHMKSFNEIIELIKLSDDGTFETQHGKSIAQCIYNYRKQFVYEYGDSNNYIDIFAIFKPPSPPDSNSLNDISLYKLVTCNVLAFSKMVTFIYVFNNPQYFNCIKAYDHSSKKFNSINNERSTRDIIIKDILKFGDPSIPDLKQSIETQIKKINSNTSISQSLVSSVIDTLHNMNDEQLFNLINSGLV